MNTPVLLIFAVPDGATAPTVSSATLFTSSQYNTTTGAIISPGTAVTVSESGSAYGLTLGLQGDLLPNGSGSSKVQDIYSLLQEESTQSPNPFASLNGSNNISNLTSENSTLTPPVTATEFQIYVFELETSAFDNKDIINVSESAPVGSYAVGYGANSQNVFSTPFTEAGWVNGGGSGGGGGGGTVPEPSTLLVMAAGLLGLGYLMRRRRSV